MDLGSDWFGCLKRFSRSIIINYYVFPCFLQESNSYSAKDYLKFDCSNYDLHMLKFLWKGFAFCLYEGWLVWILHEACSMKQSSSGWHNRLWKNHFSGRRVNIAEHTISSAAGTSNTTIAKILGAYGFRNILFWCLQQLFEGPTWRFFLSVFAGGTAALLGVASRGRTPLHGGIWRSSEFTEGRSSMAWTYGNYI